MSKIFCKDCKWYHKHSEKKTGINYDTGQKYEYIEPISNCDSPLNIKYDYKTGKKFKNYKQPEKINDKGECEFYEEGECIDTKDEDYRKWNEKKQKALVGVLKMKINKINKEVSVVLSLLLLLAIFIFIMAMVFFW